MFATFKKHPEKAIIILVLLVLLPAFFIVQHFWPMSARFSTAHVASEHGIFDIHHWQENGAQVAFVPLPELPIVDITILFPAGSAFDNEQHGLAFLTAQMIGEDTDTQDAQNIHEAFENVGSKFSTEVTRDYSAVYLRTLSDHSSLTPSIDMLKQLLETTTFKEATFQREKNRLLAAIQLRDQSPGNLAQIDFYEAAYGEHPYAHPIMGTQDTIQALTTQDLDKFFSSYYARNYAVIAISGDISLRQAQNIANDLLEGLPLGIASTQIPLVPTPQAKKDHVTFPSTQTHILLGMPAMAKGNPDFFAFSVGNHILGVSPLVSRLFSVVREQEGLAYNIASYLVTLKQPGPFVVNLQTRGNEAKKALDLAQKTLEQYIQQGPTEDEIKNAKANINGSFALGIGSNEAIVNLVAMMAFYGLPWDYYQTYRDNINAVTKEDIQRVLREYLPLSEFVQVSVGEHAP